MIVIGIDPGRKGFAYNLQEDLFLALPYKENGELDALSFREFISNANIVFSEMPIGKFNSSVLKRHQDFGEIKGIVKSLGIEFRWLMPKVWKDYYSLGVDKNASIAMAKLLKPELDLNYKTPSGKITNKADDNKAEAFLIAYYGNKVLNQNSSSSEVEL